MLSSFKTWSGFTPTSASPPPVPPKGAITASPSPAPSNGASLWQRLAAPAAYAVGGALLAGAAAGTAAYYKRDDIGIGYAWVTDHLKYVGNLWNKDELEARLDKLFAIEAQLGVLFHTYVPGILLPCTMSWLTLQYRLGLASTHSYPRRHPPSRTGAHSLCCLTQGLLKPRTSCQTATQSRPMKSRRT